MAIEHDVVIVGGGVVGLGIGIGLLRGGVRSVKILESEDSLAVHGSGRNSGVLHAGFYYSPDSLKARLTRDGNERLKQLCRDEDVPLRECGKVVVARDSEELARLEALYSRALENEVEVHLIDQVELAKLEPEARSHEGALWSPNTAVANPVEVTVALSRVFLKLGGSISFGARVSRIGDGVACLESGLQICGKHVVNAAGLYADRLAHSAGFGERYLILPFKGLYLHGDGDAVPLQRHVYPVPDPRNPFLGVHLTVKPDGSNKIGPTAIPALSRLNYSRFSGVKAAELWEVVTTLPRFLMSKQHNGMSLAGSEALKVLRPILVREAQRLVPRVKSQNYLTWGKSGIRAQLFDTHTHGLEMDFVLEQSERQSHVLNAVSPAWTGTLSLGKYVAERILCRI